MSASNIVVSYTNASGVLSILQPNTYSVSLNAAVTGSIWGVGGTVTYPLTGSPIASGTSLTIQRILPLTQSAEISNQGNQYPIVTEQALDIQCMETQQVSARTGSYRGVWAAGVAYNVGDYVIDGTNGANTGNYYMCVISNTSSVWATELAAGDWSLAINITSINTSVTAAAASATAAAASATTSTTEAGVATTQAGISTTQANASLASAQAAAASAAAASATTASLVDVSTTSNTIGTGTKTFTVSAGKSFAPGIYLVITDTGIPSDYMHGSVTSYSGTTLVMNISDTGGSGTFATWNISPSVPNLSVNAAGTSGQIQYNNSGVLGGVSTTGSGNVVLATSPSLVTPVLGTPTSGTLTNCTGLPVAGGGTGVATLTAYAPVFGGTTTTGAVQSGTVGTAGQVLTSNGAGALPTFQSVGGGGGGLVKIATINASGLSSVVFDATMITSSYNKYVIEFDGVYTSGQGSLLLSVSTNNGSSYLSSNYTWWGNSQESGSSSLGFNFYTGAGNIDFGLAGNFLNTSTTLFASGSIEFSNPSASAVTLFLGRMVGFDGVLFQVINSYGKNSTTTPINNIQLTGSAGTLTGHFVLYGYAP